MSSTSTEKKIIYASLLIGFFNLLALVFGLIRDRIIAAKVGPGMELDVYYAAFKLPDFAYILITSVVSAVVIVPLLARYIKENNDAKLQSLMSTLIIFTGFVLSAFLFLIYIFSNNFISYYVPGFSAEQKILTESLVNVLLMQPLILAISSIFAALSQAKERFFFFSLAPVLYNFGGIVGAAFLYETHGIVGLCYGVVLGAFLHLLINLYGVIQLKIKNLKFKIFDREEMVTVLKHGAPRTTALSIQQFRILMFATLGSLLPVGAISIYNLSFNLYWIPFTVLVVSYIVASYPKFTMLDTKDEIEDLLNKSIQYLIFILLPVITFGIVLRAHIVRLVYGAGTFDWQDTRLIAAAFGLFLFVIIFDAMRRLFSRVLFARGVVWSQVFIEGFLLITQVFVFFILYKKINYFSDYISNILRIDINMSPVLILVFLFMSLTIIEILILSYFVKKYLKVNFKFKYLSSLTASILGGVFVYVGLYIFEKLNTLEETFIGLFLQASVASIMGAVVWYFALKVMCNEEIVFIEKAFLDKFWKKKIEPQRQSEVHNG